MPDSPKPQQTLVMSGASSGIGRYAARYLLRDYPVHHLLLLVRGGRGEQIAAELAAETRNPNVSVVPCDLASLSDIRAAAAEIGRLLDSGALPPLHGFLGNAGVQQSSLTRTTADGFEMTFGVNVLANYLLIRMLLDRFAPPSRIVITGSDVHFADFRHNLGVVPSPHWSDTAAIAAPGTGPAAKASTCTPITPGASPAPDLPARPALPSGSSPARSSAPCESPRSSPTSTRPDGCSPLRRQDPRRARPAPTSTAGKSSPPPPPHTTRTARRNSGPPPPG
jgi:NAD(P)-dependent dehydrogenase (short-subunit alcohol dehydrogenase family)